MVGCSFVRRVENAPMHKPGFQPLSEDALVHWDMSQQPIMADPVEATFDVAFQYPGR